MRARYEEFATKQAAYDELFRKCSGSELEHRQRVGQITPGSFHLHTLLDGKDHVGMRARMRMVAFVEADADASTTPDFIQWRWASGPVRNPLMDVQRQIGCVPLDECRRLVDATDFTLAGRPQFDRMLAIVAEAVSFDYMLTGTSNLYGNSCLVAGLDFSDVAALAPVPAPREDLLRELSLRSRAVMREYGITPPDELSRAGKRTHLAKLFLNLCLPPSPTRHCPFDGKIWCALTGANCQQSAKKVCGSCKVVRYCSADHQRMDWKIHRAREPYLVVFPCCSLHLAGPLALIVGSLIHCAITLLDCQEWSDPLSFCSWGPCVKRTAGGHPDKEIPRFECPRCLQVSYCSEGHREADADQHLLGTTHTHPPPPVCPWPHRLDVDIAPLPTCSLPPTRDGKDGVSSADVCTISDDWSTDTSRRPCRGYRERRR